MLIYLFFSKDRATTEIYTLSLHDALPISVALLPGLYSQLLHHRRGLARAQCDHRVPRPSRRRVRAAEPAAAALRLVPAVPDRKSTRLNSSHGYISYAVFCLKTKVVDCS